MYEGAFIPGIFLAGLYALYVFIISVFYPNAAPGLPVDAVGFKETNPRLRDGLARANGVLLFAGAIAALWILGHHLTGAFQSGAVAGIASGTDLAEAVASYVGYGLEAILILLLLWSLIKLARRVQLGGDERGLLSLAVLAIASGFFGWFMMRNSQTHGADFVVLSMFNGIIFAFAVAVLNWVTSRFIGLHFLSKIAQQTTFVMVPPLFLIFLVLGTIFIGVATPTEGGAMGATGALILGAMKRRLSWDLVRQATESTAKLSAFVVFILVGARVFSLTFYGVSGHIWVENLLTSLPGGQIGFLIFVNAFVFVLAFFLDFFELAFIVIPLLGPAAEHLGIDLIWFGVILGVNMQTSFMHPPFGFALFYLRSVAPREPFNDRVTGKRTEGVTTGQIYWGAVPFVAIQVFMVLLVI
jgi:TRAP-type mannitol/chloroaromatic compound transport system permease large subunit